MESSVKKIPVSIIASVYNEEASINSFWVELEKEVSQLTDYSFNVFFVNDGSKDQSQKLINEIVKSNTSTVKVISIEFSRNYGHEAAMLAGIDSAAQDDIIVCLDSDLQHPPDKIKDMLISHKNGTEIVLMNRVKRHDNGIIKNIFSKVFYKVIEKLSSFKFEQNASDFFLISGNVANIMRSDFRERNRFLRGFIQIIGFNIGTVDFEAPARFAGESSYSFKSLFGLGFTAIFAFSNKPLKISLYFSIFFVLLSVGIIFYSLGMYFFGDTPPSGYTSLIVFQSIGFSVLSFLISILSIYFGRSLEEIRSRPVYLIKSLTQSK